jgi:serpin B
VEKYTKQIPVAVLGFMLLWARPVSAQVQSLVASNTAFGLNLYGRLAANSDNVFFSPYSISTCLAMLYAGAGGDTAQQMSQVLGFGTNQAQLPSVFGELQRQLEASQDTNTIDLNIANALWTQVGFPFVPAFLDTATGQYQASVNQADFVTSADAATQAINSWAAQETQGKIQNLVPPGSLTPLTRLVLANAIYFKGAWSVAFEPTNTVTQPFYLSSTTQVTAPLMHQPSLDTLEYGYFAATNFQALELPYGSNQVSMVILLPSQADGYRLLEQQLSPAFFDAVLAQLRKQPVEIFLPKFTLESSFDLTSTLAQMGMPKAFLPGGADFSGIDSAKDLYVSFVFHKAWGEVNEQGTEAAAATVGGVSTTVVGIGNPKFRADHPFIFFIRDTQSGSVLFMGRLVNPGQSTGAAPQLQVGLDSVGRLSISWPNSPEPFVLQDNSSLMTTTWRTVTNAPTVIGPQIQVVLSRSPGNKFYRLLRSGN